jgi:hypothetical protein
MSFNDFFDDRQPETCAFLFCCHERSKDVVVPFFGNAVPLITDLYGDA